MIFIIVLAQQKKNRPSFTNTKTKFRLSLHYNGDIVKPANSGHTK